MRVSIKNIIFMTVVSLLWLAPLQAQDSDNEGIARMVTITAKDGHEDALVKAITDYHKWVANFEGHHVYQWYSVETGPDTGKFVARTAGHNWADFDQDFDWEKEAGEVFKNNVAPHIENVDVQFTKAMNDISHWPESFEGYTHYSVADWYIKNGQYGAFKKGLQTIVDALKASDFPNHWGFFSVESGGYGGQIRIVGANRGWSDFSEPDPSFSSIMTEALGGEEEFQKFMGEWAETYKPGRNWVVKFMPEASDYGTD